LRRLGASIWAKRVWIAAIVAAFFAAATAYVVWAVQDLPDPSQGVLAVGDVIVLDRHGHLIEDWSHEGHYHVNLQLDQMGKYAPAATIAAEDRNFYHHGGVDVGSTLRALWVDITSRGLNEGGSTITQQLVKIQLLTPQKSFERKLHEMVLAVALEQRGYVLFVERHLASAQLLDLLCHDIANNDLVAELREARASHEAHPAGAEDAYLAHRVAKPNECLLAV